MRRHLPTRLGEVFTRTQALKAGFTRHQIEWALKSGRWLTLRRATYCRRETYDGAAPRQRHLLHCVAALLAHDDRHVLSHLSAALTFGLPAPLGDLGRPTLTLGGMPASTDRQPDLVVQVAGLQASETRGWKGFRRTSMTRTVADCLRHLSATDAVPIADAAVRAGGTTISAVASTLDRQSNWPYAARGRAGLELVDARRESWLESFSFVALHAEGIELPVPQVEIYSATGFLLGRVDGFWPQYATVAEADGRTKYALSDWTDTGQADAAELIEARVEAARRSLIREKIREDGLRAAGLEVVRWGTHDIVHARAQLATTIRLTWRRGDPARFVGTAVAAPSRALTWPSDPESR